jgi:hypothetical protein
MSIKQRILDKMFFQIYFEKKIGNSLNSLLTESEMKTTDPEKVIRVKNNESFLTPDNWEQHKNTFVTQRLESYKCSYTKAEKINLEVERLKVLTTDTTDSRILKDRYRAFLLSQLEQPAKGTRSDDWFVVGLLFASGEMDKLLKEHNNNATQIADQLNRPNLRPCISDSLGASTTAKKNLFNSRSKMAEIIKHCQINGIDIQPSFSQRLPTE